MNQSRYYVVTEGYAGYFQASSAKEAKKMLIAKIRDGQTAESKLTRCQRRYLINRAATWRVGP